MSTFAERIAALSPQQRELLELRLRQRAVDAATMPILPRQGERDAFPLSFAQQRLWFLQQLAPDTPAYNLPYVIRLGGLLDLAVFQRCLGEIVRRHEALRASFATHDGDPVQLISPARPVVLTLLDLQGLPEAERELAAQRLMREEVRRPFDLARGPLLRVTLLRPGRAAHVLLLTMHHIASDGWSQGVLINEIVRLYAAFAAGRPSPLPALPIQYADFALWQRARFQREAMEMQLAYWRAQLADLPVLELPIDHPRPATQTFRGDQRSLMIEPPLTELLRALSQRENVTLFMLLLAAWQTLLARYSGQNDIVVGSPIANRNRSEIEPLIGFFVNMLVLRADLSGNPPFRELLRQVQAATLESYAHQDVPFEQLVEELHPQRDLSRAPLFQVIFALQNAPLPPMDLPGLTMHPLRIDSETAKYDLALDLRESAEGISGRFEYSTDLFDAATIARMAGHVQTLLNGIVADPDRRLAELPILTDAEQLQLLVAWTPPQAAGSRDVCLHQLFEAQAARAPDAIALVFEGPTKDEPSRVQGSGVRGQDGAVPTPDPRSLIPDPWHLTYVELNRRANQLARHLQTLGVGPGAFVGVCMERSPELVIALLGVLKAGGAYLPLDPAYPAERLAFMLADAAAAVLITDSMYDLRLTIDDLEESQTSIVNRKSKIVNLRADWPAIARQPDDDLAARARPDDLAYLIYTSGSTGMPKGVMVAHRMIVNFLLVTQEHFAFDADDVMPCLASFSFDIALFELFSPLLAGGTAMLLAKEQILDLADFVVALERATVLHTLPALMRQVLAFIQQRGLSDRYAHIRSVFVGGDLVAPDLVADMRAVFRAARLYVVYGPTEGTIMCAQYRVPPGPLLEKHFVGSPFRTMLVRVCDAYGRLVPIGVRGEIWIGGTGITRGYLNRPDLTAERFVPNPFLEMNDERRTMNDEGLVSSSGYRLSAIGYRLYRTGDLGRYLPDGNVEFLGRIDDQVKVRGFRIELGEVEVALRSHPALQDAVVAAREDESRPSGSPDRQLVAYLVPRSWSEGSQLPGAALPAEQVAEWQMVFDEAYQQVRPLQDPTFNISGWNSSYTGQPIPAAEMRAWLDQTITRIRDLRPNRVIEIGCGTGLVLFRIAPLAAQYLGTDFSPAALSYLRQQLQRLDRALPQVALLQRPADDLAGLAAGSFDTVILNSVVQYFPSIEYLVRVLAGAAQLVAPGGCIFVGDVRSLPLLEAFHTSVEQHQVPDALPTAQLRQRVHKHMDQEQELVVDPAFFSALHLHIPRISHVRVLLKRSRYHNELTRFRYDVLLYVDAPLPAVEVSWLDWRREGLTPAAVRRILVDDAPATLGLFGVPNARLAGDLRALELLAGAEPPATVGELRQALAAGDQDAGVDPEELWALGDELAYAVEISWSGDGPAGSYDVVFQHARLAHAGCVAVGRHAAALDHKPWGAYANNPLQEKLARRLIPALRTYLKEKLPEYMMPSAFMLLDALPLTHNGKVDRQALPALPQALPELEGDFVAPRTPVEQALAGIWAQVLGLEQVGVNNNFFALGGDSIHSIQVVARANQAGLRLTPRQLFQCQTIAELAALVEASSAGGPAQLADDALTPYQRWFFEHDPPAPQRWSRAVLLETPRGLNAALLQQALRRLLPRHDALRLRFARRPAGWELISASAELPFTRLDLMALPEPAQPDVVAAARAELIDGLDLARGPLGAVLFEPGERRAGQLLLVIHHLLADEASWRILLEDLQTTYEQLSRGEPITLPAQTSSFRAWARRLAKQAQTAARHETDYWLAEPRARVAPLPLDEPGNDASDDSSCVTLVLGGGETRSLLHEVHAAYRTRPDDLLLAALAQVLARWSGSDMLLIDMVRDGREPLFDDLDLSRSVGRFTTIFPLLLEAAPGAAPGELLKAIKEQVHGVPHAGVGYGLLRYLAANAEIGGRLRAQPQAEVCFAYLGELVPLLPAAGPLKLVEQSGELSNELPGARRYLLELRAWLREDQLHLEWTYRTSQHQRAVIERLAQEYLAALRALMAHCLAPASGGYTPSDFPRARVSQHDLDRFLSGINQPGRRPNDDRKP
jgi:amino acid adenylation domain-containing protein/non-ribosomal peptide synthase protein (TIGR01720 family)